MSRTTISAKHSSLKNTSTAEGPTLPPCVVWLAALLMAAMLLAGCTTRYMPVQQPGVQVVDDTAVLLDTDLRLTVTKRDWLRQPDAVNDYYTTFYVQVRNMSISEVQSVSPAEFGMLDGQQSQFDPVPTGEVASLLLDRDPYARYVGDLSLTPTERDDRIRQQTEARANLQTYAFAFGDILPGATKSGYIFFNRLPSGNSELSFVFRQRPVRFARIKD